MFVLFTPKWIQVQRLNDINKILAQQTASQLSTSLASIAVKPSLLAQEVYADNSDNKLV